ncbi:MAG: hypothetical protein ABGX05_00555 [Pirellulaceae bacterium]
MKIILRCLACLLLTGITGCQTLVNGLQDGPPGPIYEQQSKAVLHDPYPNTEAAPEIIGGRPRGYQQPLPEAVNNRLWVDSFPGK